MSKRNKQKSKQRAKQQRQSGGFFGGFRSRQPDPAIFAMQAGALIEAGKPDEALDLLEPLLEDYPRSAQLLGTAAVAYLHVGDLWPAIDCFERAQKVQPEPVVWATLAGLYLQAGLHTYAREAIYHARKDIHEQQDRLALEAMLAPIEAEFEQMTKDTGLVRRQVEIGLRHHDDALRALAQSDWQVAIDASRRAIRIMGDWPPAHNNLTQALFFSGKHADAIATSAHILSHQPDNLHALGNSVKFLAWGGKADEARAMWERLRPIAPASENDRIKIAEAAAVMEEDAIVYQTLKPLADAEAVPPGMAGWQVLLHLAIAEANTQRTKQAIRRLNELGEEDPRVHTLLQSLEAKKPGLGWSTRYPYFTLPEIMPRSAFAELDDLMTQLDQLDEQQAQKRVDRFVQRYPQLLIVARKLIWEEMQPQFGLAILDMMGTPEAYAVLREFGFSQVGNDSDRMEALILVKEAGLLNDNKHADSELVRMWSDGEWREVKLISYEISDEVDIVYSPRVVKIYERALDAFHRGDHQESERLLKEVIALEPNAADAYFNLAATYAARQEIEQAKAMCLKAIELRPLYALPRCQLAQFYLLEENVEAAKEIMLPLTDASRLNTLEASMYMFTQARILIAEHEYEKAHGLLESLLMVNPDFAPAMSLLERLPMLELMGTGLNRFFEDRRFHQERRRLAMQTKLKTLDVTVDMALGVFNREQQKTVAPYIMQHGSWSAYKKKELHDTLRQTIETGDHLGFTVQDLRKKERAALREVLKHGGVMAWDDFDKRYGNDLEENPDWQYEEPETLMGRLRQRILLSVATVDKKAYVVVPVELRQPLDKYL